MTCRSLEAHVPFPCLIPSGGYVVEGAGKWFDVVHPELSNIQTLCANNSCACESGVWGAALQQMVRRKQLFESPLAGLGMAVELYPSPHLSPGARQLGDFWSHAWLAFPPLPVGSEAGWAS